MDEKTIDDKKGLLFDLKEKTERAIQNEAGEIFDAIVALCKDSAQQGQKECQVTLLDTHEPGLKATRGDRGLLVQALIKRFEAEKLFVSQRGTFGIYISWMH